MSYQQPQDYYTHSNASQYDDRYQQGSYRDEYNQSNNHQQYSSGGNGGYGSGYPQNQAAGYGGYQDASPMNTPYGSRYDLDHQQQQQQQQQQDTQGGAYKDYAGSDAYYADAGAPNAASAAAQTYSYGPPKQGTSKWLKYGLPLLILVLIGGGVGGYFGWKASKDDSTSSSSSGKAGDTNSWTGSTSSAPPTIDSSTSSAASNAAKSGGGNDITYSGTDVYANPMFLSSAANLGTPSMGGTQAGNCASDPFSGTGSTDADSLRPHPRLMAPQYLWDCMPEKIANDAYLTVWNATIFKNATAWAAEPPVQYVTDGGLVGSGILDPARDVQQRVKAWGYAYQVSKDTKWVDRMWVELQTAAGNTSQPWGQGNVEGTQDPHWNSAHFLDLAELTAAYAIAYDWLYNVWSDDQKTKLMWSIIELGLVPGNAAFDTGSGWFFQPANGNGNWNCVCNSGLMLGSLAVLGDDPTNNSAELLKKTINNMSQNCMRGVYTDGTWSETPNYWYFGTNAHARAISSLTTATGTDQGLMAQNQDFTKTGIFHMYVSGMGGMFAYADNGPNKYATTANQMFLYSTLEKNPLYGLFQRDRADAADPLSMIWYDTTTKGAFWDGLALDNYFNDANGSWVSMRSSWTDFTGTYVAMKASILTGHQSHGDLDVGDFVIDAMGTRWAGEFGNANYLSSNYFSNETQTSDRWEYYRKGTQGQNTLVIGETNQLVTAAPVNSYGSTNAAQSAALDYKPGVNDVAYFKTDMSSAYGQDAGTVQRGIRMLNGRRQVLVQDEITSTVADKIMWLVQTNATITLSSDKRTATMKIQKLEGINAGFEVDGSLAKDQTMIVSILSPATATFEVVAPLSNDKPDRIYGKDPNVASGEEGDQEQPGVNRLQITLNGGTHQTIQVWWQPQWADLNSADTVAPKNVPLASWTTTSHNV